MWQRNYVQNNNIFLNKKDKWKVNIKNIVLGIIYFVLKEEFLKKKPKINWPLKLAKANQ